LPVRGVLIVALALISLGVGATVIAAGGPDNLDVQFASTSERFTALYTAPSGGIDETLVEETRDSLRLDYVFIAFYVAAIVAVVATTGRRRPLGRRAPTTFAVVATVAAGVLDVGENLAISRALDQLVDGRAPDAGRVTDFAMAKWILLGAVAAHLLVRALGTPRRRSTRALPGKRYRLYRSRDDVASVVPGAAIGEPAPVHAPAPTPPGVMEQLRVDPAVDHVSDAAERTASATRARLRFLRRPLRRLRSAARAVGRWIESLFVALFVDPRPVERDLGLENRPGDLTGVADQAQDVRRVGVACSGGGIRSASFTLGALQVLRERGVLARASHVTAVSGGGYLAAGWAIAASRVPASAADIYGPGSPEERWLRRHSSLLPNARIALTGVGRALFGMAVNLVLIWLVLIAASRPIGWLEHVVHPELRGRQPYVAIVEQPEVRTADAQHADPVGSCPAPADGSSGPTGPTGAEPRDVPALCIGVADDVVLGASGTDPVRAWPITPILEPALVDVWDDSDTADDPDEVVLDLEPGLVAVVGDELVVVRQPAARVRAEFVASLQERSRNADPEVGPFLVSSQPELTVVDPSVPDVVPSAAQLRVEAPTVDQRSGTTGRPDLEYEPWMWWLVAVTGGLFIVTALVRSVWRPVKPVGSAFFRGAVAVSAAAAIGSLAVVAVIPWLIHELPPALARLVTAFPGPDTTAAQSSEAAGAVAAGGAAVLTLATVVNTLRGPVLLVAKRWPMIIAKVVVAIVLIGVPIVLFVNSLALAAANGPGGHLIGLWASRVHFPVEVMRSLPDVARWFVVLAALAVWRNIHDAHTLSLFPFYKRRMSESFAVERRVDGTAAPVPYEIELAWTDTPTRPLPAKGFGKFRLRPDDTGDGGPELVLCATANTYRVGEAPTGRRATPFTFSSTVVGGPDVGYLPTGDYLDALGLSRRKDVTIPAALAISGAAFSPGMGKMSMGPIDNLMAVTNARLGVWIPNPTYVAEQRLESSVARWRDRPGWPWFMRELISGFRLGAPYLYVTDGGHWENLGMVELLRRGCRDIVVVSAAGDGAAGFATIGEAIALAREELELEVAVDLEPLRAVWSEPGDDLPPPLLRRGADGAPLPVAADAFARGVIRDLRAGGGDYGTIVILEANLSAGLPWDVATWAEGHAIFPDDPTLDQNFDHRQFESYRRLGRFQMTRALTDDAVRDALGASDGPADPADPVVPPPAVAAAAP
jgi:hypothetical protein